MKHCMYVSMMYNTVMMSLSLSADGPEEVQSPASEEACLPAESSEGKDES